MGLGLFVLSGEQARAQQAQLTNLSDVSFGVLSTTANDMSRSQNVCAYAASVSGQYGVRAQGSGTGGALTLAGSSTPLAYEVQWAASSNQSSGTALPANTTVGGFSDGLLNNTCSLLTTTSASLIVMLRATALSSVTAGGYSGTLTLILAPQ